MFLVDPIPLYDSLVAVSLTDVLAPLFVGVTTTSALQVLMFYDRSARAWSALWPMVLVWFALQTQMSMQLAIVVPAAWVEGPAAASQWQLVLSVLPGLLMVMLVVTEACARLGVRLSQPPESAEDAATTGGAA